MNEASAVLQEPPARLRDHTVELHRALVSLREELQAVDSYRQRADACRDPGLRAILEHHRDEEIAHAAMLLAWLRREDAGFARHLDACLRGDGPVSDDERGTDSVTAPVADDRDAVEAFTVGPMKETP
jgi:hypothetical protein